MSNPDHILDSIDRAVEDWEVSGDAMRWTPESPAAPTRESSTGHTWGDLINSAETMESIFSGWQARHRFASQVVDPRDFVRTATIT